MLFIYGDSHANRSFKNINIPHKDYHQNSITMFRIGRDNIIINFNKDEHTSDSIICLAYGEIDCRCHIQRQIDSGKNEDIIITELVENYFKTIQNNIKVYKKIIIVGVMPPTKQNDYESINDPITHEFPFVGKDEDRVRFTLKVNLMFEAICKNKGYIYFNPYSYYTREDGTLKYELSDQCVHLGHNSVFLDKFMDVYNMI